MWNKFDKIIKNNNANNFGNQTLYSMCSTTLGKDTVNTLGSKLWIIGRTYAASPERRYINNVGVYHGQGLGEFFVEIANSLLKNSNYNKLIKDLQGLNPYQFDYSKNDIDILEKVVDGVLVLNECLHSAFADFDKAYNSISNISYRNLISFCSKFLHFHFPNIVFIFDNYAEKGAKALVYKQNKNNELKEDYLDKSPVIITNYERQHFKKYKGVKFKSNNSIIENFKKHCIKEYTICCEINAKGLSVLNYYTRTVDAICQRVQ